MKKWILISLLMGFSFSGRTQTIQSGEYFLDADPGVGNGTGFAITPGNTVNQDFQVSTLNLLDGFHTLTIRFRDADGKWGLYSQRSFFVASVNSPSAVDIVAAEYLIDADPGVSTATPISVPVVPGTFVSLNIDVSTSSLSPGFHSMAIRFQNSMGLWGLYSQRMFYVTQSANLSTNIIGAEYFIDDDPGIGLGAAITIPVPVPVFNTPYTVPLPNGLSNGQHFLYMRVLDDQNLWSLFAFDTFFVDQSLPVSGMKLQGEANGSGHLLEWFTLTETNSDYFEIEHSTNGVQFQYAGKTMAAGNSTTRKEYSFLFTKMAAGKNYYRLKQVDKDGHSVYSNIIMILGSAVENSLRIFPNPAQQEIQFEVGQMQGPYTVSIVQANGQIIKTERTTGNRITISSLPKGSFLISISNGLEVRNGRFLKLE